MGRMPLNYNRAGVGVYEREDSGRLYWAVLFIAEADKLFCTKYDATIINYILFFLCFGFIWMWF
jgi:hypothetical protein